MKAGCHLVAIAQVVRRALMAKVRGPQFNLGWLPVFHGSLNLKYSFIMYMYMYLPQVSEFYFAN